MKKVLDHTNLTNLLSFLLEDTGEKKITVNSKKALEVGKRLKVDWDKVDLEEFTMGMNVELEHGSKFGSKTNVTHDDLLTTAKIALAHLEELPDYYSRLKAMEKDKNS